MRTKTLLIATAAALAAGIISSQAQVYSQNIVGYVNTPIPTGFVNIANPLDGSSSGGVNNTITNIVNVFSGNYDGDLLYIFNGATYNVYTLDSSQPTGVGNSSDTAAVAPPVIAPGIGIFIQNTASPITNTFVGTVHIDGTTGTNVVGITTNALSLGFRFISSKLPVGGGISSVLKLPNDGSLDGSIINIPNIVGGNVRGFTQITIDSSQPTGFGNSSDTASVPEPIIPVGTGFFLQDTSGNENWVQSY
jgi:hypothetical protein